MSALTFKEFDSRLEPFESYVKRLEQHFILQDVKQEKKVPAILSLMGAKTYALLCNLVVPHDPENQSYEDIVKILTNHLSPTPNKITERIKFRRRMQLETESIQEFCADLKKLSKYCEFTGDALNENLLEQFLRGLRNEQIQQRLLTNVTNLTFDKAVDQAVTMQTASTDLSEWKNNNISLNKVSTISKGFPHSTPAFKGSKFQPEHQKSTMHFKKKVFNANIKCYRCGDNSHLANNCKFIHSKCHSCGKLGHLKQVCRSMQKKLRDNNVLQTLEVLTVNTSSASDPMKIRVKIENTAYADMELDTGSAISTIPAFRFNRVFPNWKICPPDVLLKTATGEVFEPLGFVNILVEIKDQRKLLKWYLIKNDNFPLLFGRDWFKEFSFSPSDIQPINVISNSITKNSRSLHTLFDTYKELFGETVGEIKGVQAHLQVARDTKPIFCRARPVPYALQKRVEEELDRLHREGIIEPVTYSKWATPIVPVVKPNGRIRICGDFKVTVNKSLEIDTYPLPKIDDIFSSLSGGKHFSKIDLNQAYLHMRVEEECQELITLNTHKGLYRLKRLPYGIASAPAIWQKTIEQVLTGIEGVNVFIDDICVTGPTDDIHLQRLEDVFKRLQQFNLKINISKSTFFADSITYCGYMIDKEGIHKTEEKIEAIRNAPHPTNVTELKAFLGLVTYYSRFIQNLSSLTYPLNQLLKKNANFTWNTRCENAFTAIKKEIMSERVLTHFNPDLSLILATDASSYGVSAVLSHLMPDGSEKPIAFASRTLNSSEKRYSQIDKEALAIIFGVKKFFQFLYGRRFTLYTDNKPLVSIFSPEKSIPLLSAARMQRYALYLQSFRYDIRYKSTTSHGNADALSRLPIKSEDLHVPDEAEIFQINQLHVLPVTARSLATATKNDPSLKRLYHHLISGTEISKEHLHGGKPEEFTLEQGCILRGCRVLIPDLYRKQILQELHEGHFGIVKMKTLARSLVWWPGIDHDIEQLTKNCTSCVQNKNNPSKVTTHPWEWPSTPWQRLHVDYAGPIMDKMLLVIVDAHSKWPEVFVLNKITTEKTIDCLKLLFSRFGLPVSLVSDNGPQFTSLEFQNFLKAHGIRHHLSAPYHPATNGQAERFVQIIKKGLKAVAHEPTSFQDKLNTLLMQYRKMPNTTTGESPAYLFLKRNIRTKLDLVLPNIHQHVQERQHKAASPSKQFFIGDKVAARNYTPKCKWKIGHIIARDGTLHYKIQIGDTIWRRHVDQLTPVGQDIPLTATSEITSHGHPQPHSPPVCVPITVPDSPPVCVPITVPDSPPVCVPTPVPPNSLPVSIKLSAFSNTPGKDIAHASTASGTQEPSLRRSTRNRKQPCRLQYS